MYMKILSIGNSFSVDCQRYVGDIASSLGTEVTLGNLYIGGCSLERHCQNMDGDLIAYDYFWNNKNLGLTRLSTALGDDDWDVVTLQQASHFSGDENTYFPHIERLAKYVRSVLPNTQLFVNQTWAYEYDSTHTGFPFYGNDRFRMQEMIEKCYTEAAQKIGAKLIPVGTAVSNARKKTSFEPEKGGIALTRDGFHLSYSYGRLLAGYVWCKTLLGSDISQSAFRPADYEFVGHDKQNGMPLYREIPETRVDEGLLKELMSAACEL